MDLYLLFCNLFRDAAALVAKAKKKEEQKANNEGANK